MESQRLSKFAWWLYHISTLVLVGLPIGAIMVFANFASAPESDGLLNIPVPLEQLSPGPAFWAGVCIKFLPLVTAMLALYSLRELFRHYMQGEVLTANCARMIWKTGIMLFATNLLRIILVPIETALLSWTAPQGQRLVSFVLSLDEVAFFLISGLLIVIGWAMSEAARAAEENRGFV